METISNSTVVVDNSRLESNNTIISKEKTNVVTHDKRFMKDTGYAWVIVFGSFLVQSCCYGLPLTFGIFQDYYLNNNFKGESKGKISLIGTICLATMGLGSSLSGKLMDIIGIKKVILLGAVFVFFSHLLASFSTQVWQLILTQGLLLGIGCSILYIPSNAIIAQWFEKKTGLAYGICSSGSGLGSVFYSMLNAKLLMKLGPAWTLRINGAIMIVQLLFCVFTLKSHPGHIKKTNKVEKSEVLNFPFYLLCISMLLFACSYPTTMFFLPGQISKSGYGPEQYSFMISLMSGMSAGGRIIVGYIADKLGHLNIYILCTFVTTFSFVMLFFEDITPNTKYSVYIAFAVIFGLFSGGLVGIFGAVVSTLFGTKNISLLMGLTYAPTGLGELIGPPSAGVLMDKFNNYLYLNIYTCVLLFLSSLGILSIKIFQVVKNKN